jgi:hypothetical protein
MTEQRDVNNHLLFEVATEVANRGTPASMALVELHANRCCSGRHLLGPQIQSPGNDGRIWLRLHIVGPAQQKLGTLRAAIGMALC